jgi:hypothetical protein
MTRRERWPPPALARTSSDSLQRPPAPRNLSRPASGDDAVAKINLRGSAKNARLRPLYRQEAVRTTPRRLRRPNNGSKENGMRNIVSTVLLRDVIGPIPA